jgi:hypothetical protein
MNYGRRAASTAFSAANSHLVKELLPTGPAGIGLGLFFGKAKRRSAAFKDRHVALGERRNLTKGSMTKVIGITVTERDRSLDKDY